MLTSPQEKTEGMRTQFSYHVKTDRTGLNPKILLKNDITEGGLVSAKAITYT